MADIIPSINAQLFSQVKEKITKVEPYVPWVHLDVTDGIFSKHKTWNNPQELKSFFTSVSMEVHLMVSEPDSVIGKWIMPQIKRIITQIEAVKNPDLIIEDCEKCNIEAAFAAGPETSVEKLTELCSKINFFTLLAVSPGPSGQKLSANTYQKIQNLRSKCSAANIEVDGGVTPENSHDLTLSGANFLVSGNYIFNSKDIKAAIEKLKDNSN